MATLSIVSCHSHVSRPCCILAAAPHVFLFNCPAGSTRHSSDQHLRLVRSTRIYVTRLAQDCVGGLPGLLFCIEEARGPDASVVLVGPVGLKRWFASARSAFLHWLRLRVNIIEVTEDTVWAQQDVPIVVHAFLRRDEEPPEPALKRQCGGSGGTSGPSVVYYVRMADHPGKFDVEKAKAFALVPRLHYAALKRGESVIAISHFAADGTTVRAEQVVAAPLPGKSFAIIDHCNISGASFDACTRALALQPDTVLHYATDMAPDIEHSLKICERAVHVGVWGAAVELSSMSAGHAVRRMLCPHMFPEIASSMALCAGPPPSSLLCAVPGLACNIAPPFKFGWQPISDVSNENQHIEEYLSQIQEHRTNSPSGDVCTVLDFAATALPTPPATTWRTTFLGTGGALPSKHRNVSAILLSYQTHRGDTAFTKMRHILLDCGEATMFQLARLVGPAQSIEIIASLDFVWLSHTHADHILGLCDIARAYFHTTGMPLQVFCPRKLHIPLNILYPKKIVPVREEDEDGGVTISEGSLKQQGQWACPTCNCISDFNKNKNVCSVCQPQISEEKCVHSEKVGSLSSHALFSPVSIGEEAEPVPWLTFISSLEGIPIKAASCSDLEARVASNSSASISAATIREHVPSCELLGVEAVRVDHSCRDAWGIKCTMPDGTAVVYSGDTVPCEALETLGRSAALVIHEANFEDSMLDLAKKKKHSTTSGAIESCLRMGAQIIALTHFSQRYPKIPKFAEHGNVFFAFDFSVLHPGLQVHPRLHGALSLLFSTDDDDEEEAAATQEPVAAL